ncbi:MAG: hypothetical protein QOH72_1687 [Solirubrobacteraceae bacterium]|jgi:uncharacterized protein YbjQ (UPF0145 family)|nr:hypothetical protein [Solirubrobacteraceae bacterium]
MSPGDAPDPDARRRTEESIAALEAGGIPLAASERLQAFRERGGKFFTSDLSVNELLVVENVGFRPLTQVMGTCFYRTGWQSSPWGQGGGWLGGMGWGVGGAGQTFELEQQTEAWNEARRLAIGRMAQETRLAGGDAVVGVHLRRRHHDWATGLIEFVVIGTAVRSERDRLDSDEPALSNLSGQDVSKLVRNGFRPVGLVAATTVAYVATGGTQQMSSTGLFSSMQNQEMPDFTRGVYDARALAMTRLSRQAHALHAHGVVGVTIERSHREIERDRGGGTKYTDLVIEMHVLGTAVIEVERSDAPPPISLALQLNDPERT